MTDYLNPALPMRFWNKVSVDDESGCWPWVAYCDYKGYGSYRVEGRERRAHRVAYEALRGPIPEGLVIDHLCRVRNCVNPDHLEPVTSAENSRRGEPGIHMREKSAQQTHCVNGHELTAENKYVHPPGSKAAGHKRCRQCRADVERRRYWAAKAVSA